MPKSKFGPKSIHNSETSLGVAGRIGFVWLSLVLGWTMVLSLRHHVFLPNLSPVAVQLATAVLACIVGVGSVLYASRRLERRPLSSLGLGPLGSSWRAFAFGALLWLGLATLATVAGMALGLFRVEFAAPTWIFLYFFVLQGTLVFIYEALPEELAIRGYIFTNLAERLPLWVAVIGQAILFMLWAFALVWLVSLLGVGSDWVIGLERVILFLTMGITIALIRIWTGSLWASIGFHWMFQTVTQLVFLDRGVVFSLSNGEALEWWGIATWFSAIVIGGLIALIAIWATSRRVAGRAALELGATDP